MGKAALVLSSELIRAARALVGGSSAIWPALISLASDNKAA